MFGISNTGIKDIDNSIKQTKNINNYNLTYGNNPILLAISKGWNHISNKCEGVADHLKAKLRDFHNLKSTRDLTEEEIDRLNKMEGLLNIYEKKKLNEPSIKQRDIIDTLLKRGDLDINCIYLPSGMTPLHIACMRGDSPELIQKLLNKGAKPNAVDYQGNKPIDLCSWKYDEVQKFLERMTKWKFGKDDFGNPIYPENRSATVTLPTQEERDENIKGIREILSKSIVREDPVERLDATVNPFAPMNDNSKPSTSLFGRMEYLQIKPQSTLKK